MIHCRRLICVALLIPLVCCFPARLKLDRWSIRLFPLSRWMFLGVSLEAESLLILRLHADACSVCPA